MGVSDILVLFIIIVLCVVAYFFFQDISDWFKNPFGIKINEIDLGTSCKSDIECKTPYGCDYKDFEKTGRKDSELVCVKKVPDWKGNYFNPSQCQSAPSPLGNPGDCRFGYHWPREEGEPCALSIECKGFVAGQPGLGCDPEKKQCVKMKKDWAGVYYTPSECKGWPFAPGGTCK